MTAMTLLEAANAAMNSGNYMAAGVLQTFGRSSPLLGAMMVENINGAAYVWRREVSLGASAYRAINSTFTPSNGVTEVRSLPLKIIGGEVDVDTFILDTMGQELLPQKVEGKLADMAQRISHGFIKGCLDALGGGTADVNGFDGLQNRYGGGFSTTAVSDTGENAGQILLNTGGAALSMKSLDEAISLCENPTHLLMAKKQKINITAYMRTSASLSQTRDEWGRVVTVYQGLPILEADSLGTVSGLEQLGYNENNTSSTSIYVLSIGDNGYHLVQNGGPRVSALGETDDAPAHRTRVQWYCTPVDPHPRCVVRLYGITDATATA